MIRVMLVDDSAVVRRILAQVLAEDPELLVSAQARNGRLALEAVSRSVPDVIVLDIEMPEMDGLETLTQLRRTHPDLPVIMFSTLTERGASATLDALTRGADDYVTKPSNTGSFARTAEEIRTTLVPRIKALAARARDRGVRRPSATATPRPGPSHPGARRPVAASPNRPSPAPRSRPRRTGLFRPRAVVIAVSTGGPDALARLIPELPASLSVPVLVTQHMPPIFTRLLAERLDARSAVEVVEGTDGLALRPGLVVLAPGGLHMLVRDVRGVPTITLDDGPAVKACKPAADPMFASAVRVWGGDVLALVMTGMGDDGHHGAELVRDAGGRVVCQDEPSSVVWGMPGVVTRAGLAEDVVPLDRLARTITDATALHRPTADRTPGRAPADHTADHTAARTAARFDALAGRR